jgi:hypothetical protein
MSWRGRWGVVLSSSHVRCDRRTPISLVAPRSLSEYSSPLWMARPGIAPKAGWCGT